MRRANILHRLLNRLRSPLTNHWTRTLGRIDFRSGLGDSAWLLYGITRSLKPKVAVEIGSARGKSACLIGMGLKENGIGRLYAIDPHTSTSWNDSESADTYKLIQDNLQRLGLHESVTVIRDISKNAIPNVPTPIDLLFIDGDHSYEGVKADWETFTPRMSPFGLVVFHDTIWDLRPNSKWYRPDMGVPRFVEELREHGYPVLTIDQDWGVSLIQPMRGGIPLRQK
jgi:predicted O-methyltransferase YrrM